MNAADPTPALLATPPAGPALQAVELRGLFADMAVGMLVVHASGHIVDTNPAAEALLGLPRCEIVGRHAGDPGWHAVDVDGQALAPERTPAMLALSSGRPVRSVEMGLPLFGGELRWLLVDSVPLRGMAGGPGAVMTFIDISQRRRLEQRLQQKSRRLRAVLEGTRTATWQWNVQSGEVELDLRFAEMLGLQASEPPRFTIDDWRRLIHAEDQAGLQARLQRHLDGEVETFEAEYRMREGDGSWRWVRDRGRVVSHTAEGAPLAMLGTHDDITALKEAELGQARNEDLMRALFELSPLGLQLLNVTERRVVAVNDALTQITGYERAELLDLDVSARYTERSLRLREQLFADALEKGRFGPTEIDYIHKSGRQLKLLFNGVRVSDAQHANYLWLSVADMTERQGLERALRAAACEDSLTGLLNRNALRDVLQQQIDLQGQATGTGLALFFLDFDRFKVVNDTLGHSAGDELLRAIAQRLLTVARQRAPKDPQQAWHVARFGGDEFVVVLPAAATPFGADGVRAEAQAVLAALAEPYTVRQQALHTSASIGMTMWHAGIDSADDMLRDADTAMYEAKRAGHGLAVLFDETMRARLIRAAVIEAELRHAVERGELVAVYQPIVDLDTGVATSVEALLRWQHPELGAVSPSEFIPVAEESGHIIVIGEWILRTACLQWADWQRENAKLAPATMSVNLSRKQLALGRQLITLVNDALVTADMPAAALQLEVTEREVMKSPEQARDLLRELSAMGVKLAMDDFGTGTSSLGCLRDYPFDTIKIDKSFVTNLCRDPHVLAVAHATVNVIENLGMVSVAEGIENAAEVAVLQAMGCRYGQGYLFARPLRASALLAAMADGSRAE